MSPVRHASPGPLVTLLAAVLVGTLVAPAVAMPPPAPVCGGCGDAYAAAASDGGFDLRVANSSATVRVHENGSATWTVRNRLEGTDASRVLGDPALRARLAREVSDGAFLGSSRDGDSVVYRYRQSAFAERGVGGAMVSDYFREDLRTTNYDSLGADRLTVVAPRGMTVGRAPTAATVDGDRFTLTRVDQGLVTFVPAGDSLGVVKGWISMANRLSPVVVTNLGLLLVPALVAFTLVVGVVLLGLGRLLSPPEQPHGKRLAENVLLGGASLAAVLAAYGVVTGAALPVGTPSTVFGAAVGGVVVAFAVRRGTNAADRRDVGGWGALELALVGVGAAVLATLVAGALLPGNRILDSVAATLSFTAPTFALLPAGTAVTRGRTLRALAVCIAGFVLGSVASPQLYHAPQGVVVPGFPIGAAAAGTVLVVGAPLLVAGWALSSLGPVETHTA